MTIHFKMLETLRRAIIHDLRRPHAHAGERVGFISACFGNSLHDLIVLAHSFHPVKDEQYEMDHEVGARFNSGAIRDALQIAFSDNVGIFHVHLHAHRGVPRPSGIDWTEWNKFVPNFWHVCPNLPHGALILSEDRMSGWCWYPKRNHPVRIHRFTLVGRGMQSWRSST
jgi:hypothetical protein